MTRYFTEALKYRVSQWACRTGQKWTSRSK